MGVVPGTRHHITVVADMGERRSAILGAPEAPQVPLCLRQDVDPVGIRRRDGQPDSPDHLRKAAAQLRPTVTAVGGLEHAAVLRPAEDGPGSSLRGPHGGVKRIRIVGAHDEVDGPGALVHVEHVLPVSAAVGGSVDPPVLAGAEDAAQGRHISVIGIPGMDLDAVDVAGLGQADPLPCGAVVCGSVHAVPYGDVAPDAAGTGSCVDDIRVRGGHGQGAHGSDVQKTVGDVVPRDSCVIRAPDSSAHGSHEEGVRPVQVPSHRGGPSAAGGAHRAVLHGPEQGRIDCGVRVGGLGVERRSGDGKGDERGQQNSWARRHRDLLGAKRWTDAGKVGLSRGRAHALLRCREPAEVSPSLCRSTSIPR